LLAEFGVRVGSDIVVDPDGAVPFYGAETFFADSFGVHPVTDGLSQAQLPVIFPLARSVGIGDDVEGFTVTELVKTSDAGWGETDLANLDRVERQDSDLAGPVPLAVAVSVPAGGAVAEEEPFPAIADGESEGDAADSSVSAAGDAAQSMRLLVVGNSEFVTNAHLANVGNAPFLTNTMNWLVRRESLLSIPPKKPEQVRLSLTRGEMSSITWLVLLIMPAAAVAAGVGIHLRRRR
jgi:ABC-type uncharacterized transport system involved in gliding motility auxiliary subunit